ncbi:MAG: hypothetical protein ACOVOR_01945 [Rhabdochlamydiaceae bacterium]
MTDNINTKISQNGYQPIDQTSFDEEKKKVDQQRMLLLANLSKILSENLGTVPQNSTPQSVPLGSVSTISNQTHPFATDELSEQIGDLLTKYVIGFEQSEDMSLLEDKISHKLLEFADFYNGEPTSAAFKQMLKEQVLPQLVEENKQSIQNAVNNSRDLDVNTLEKIGGGLGALVTLSMLSTIAVLVEYYKNQNELISANMQLEMSYGEAIGKAAADICIANSKEAQAEMIAAATTLGVMVGSTALEIGSNVYGEKQLKPLEDRRTNIENIKTRLDNPQSAHTQFNEGSPALAASERANNGPRAIRNDEIKAVRLGDVETLEKTINKPQVNQANQAGQADSLGEAGAVIDSVASDPAARDAAQRSWTREERRNDVQIRKMEANIRDRSKLFQNLFSASQQMGSMISTTERVKQENVKADAEKVKAMAEAIKGNTSQFIGMLTDSRGRALDLISQVFSALSKTADTASQSMIRG